MLISSLLTTITTLLQISFISALPAPLNAIPLFYLLIVCFLLFSSFKTGFFSALLSGLLLDTYSYHPFGVWSFSLPVTMIFLSLLSRHIITDKMAYAFILISIIGISVYNLIFSLSMKTLMLLNMVDDYDLWNQGKRINMAWEMFWTGILFSIILVILSLTTRKFKLYFINKGDY